MTPADQIKEKLASLEVSLKDSLPDMPTLLRDIHRQLKNDPDVVTVLTEEECNILVRGLKKQTATEITTAVLKGGRKGALKNITASDL